MAFTRVQYVVEGDKNAATATSHGITWGSATTSGNLLIYGCAVGNDTTGFTPPSGYTKIDEWNIGSSNWYWLGYKTSAGDSGTVTSTTTNNSHLAAFLVEYSASGSWSLNTSGKARGSSGGAGPGYPLTYIVPAYQGILSVSMHAARYNTAGSTYPTIKSVDGNHSAVHIGRSSHRNGSGDTQRMFLDAHDVIGTTGTDAIGRGFGWYTGTSAANGPGILNAWFDDAGESAWGKTRISNTSGTGSVVQYRTTQSAVSGTTLSFTPVSTPTAGNLMVLAACSLYSGTPPGPTISLPASAPWDGWTEAWQEDKNFDEGTTANYMHVSLWYKIADGDETGSMTATWSSAVTGRHLIWAELNGTLESSYQPSAHYHNSTLQTLPTGFSFGELPTQSSNGIGVVFLFSDTGATNSGLALDTPWTFLATTSAASNLILNSWWAKWDAGNTIAGNIELSGNTTQILQRTAFLMIGGPAPAAGQDHWAWAEGSDAMDSWGVGNEEEALALPTM